jgi:putative flippase GtrA
MTRWARFAGVGLLGFGFQLLALHVLTEVLAIDYRIAIVVAVEAAILHNFVWHERWTWRDRVAGTNLHEASLRLLKFNAASGLVSIVGNVAFTAAFVELAGAPVLIANVAAIASLTILNYLAADRLAFAPATNSVSKRIPVIALVLLLSGPALAEVEAAELKPETIRAWNEYVRMLEQQFEDETHGTGSFLGADFNSSARRASLRRGDIPLENIVTDAADIDGGTISHWRGYMFVSGVSVDDLLDGAAVRGAARKHQQEDVLDSRVLGRDGDSLRLFLKLRRTAIVTVAYNTEHAVTYSRLTPTRGTSRSVSTRIAELEDAGTSQEREKPVGKDRGFIWRLHSYWRYEAVDGGVIVQLDSVTLSRDIPWAIRVMAAPIIDRIARESMNRTLAAVRSRHAGQWSVRVPP